MNPNEAHGDEDYIDYMYKEIERKKQECYEDNLNWGELESDK